MSTESLERPVPNPGKVHTSIPPRLYKYRSLDESSRCFTEAIFRKNEVWYARASSFNDPFDCNHHIKGEMSEEEWTQQIVEAGKLLGAFSGAILGALFGALGGGIGDWMVEKGLLASDTPRITPEKGIALGAKMGEKAELTIGGRRFADIPGSALKDEEGIERRGYELLNSIYSVALEKARIDVDDRIGVFSLSEVADNILMWSHYADNHRGICIEFDAASYADAFPGLAAVEYRKTSPVVEQKFANLLVNLSQSDPHKLAQELLERMNSQDLSASWSTDETRAWFLTKSTLWKKEREWRSLKQGPGKKRIPAAAISSVIIGCVAPEETLALVRKWIRGRKRRVTLHRAIKRPDAFALNIIPIE